MKLSEKQRKHLRGLGHALKPVVYVAEAGLSPSVMQEVRTALAHHELIKVSIRVGDRVARGATVEKLAADTGAVAVQRIGNTALFYKRNPEKNRITLPA